MRSYMTDHRTPLAWRHRDMTLHSNGHHHHHSHHTHHRHHHRHRPPPSPTVTTSSSDEREEVPMVRTAPHHLRRPNSRYGQYSQFSTNEGPFHGGGHPLRSGGGTLRSTRSVPALALATWDGEPCPVHGHGMPPPLFHAGTMRRHGSLFDMRPPALYGPPPPPPPPMPLDKKSFHGSMQLMGNPWFGPPIMRTTRPPFVIPAGAEPLPVRDPYRRPPGYAPSKMADDNDYDQVCCKGHLIVLWIILAVVTIGVILGIVLGVTIV